jgi:hypothetical protein
MATRSESDEQYKMVGQDSLQWLEKAQGLKYCAQILRDHLQENIDVAPASRRVETLGLVNSTLLMLGLAFENLIKGVKIAEDPTLVNLNGFDIKAWKKLDGGHGIKSLAQSLLILESDEEELLDRLQESIFWAGRFPIPLKSERYHESRIPINKHQLSMIDFGVAEQLFSKLEKELIRFRDAAFIVGKS